MTICATVLAVLDGALLVRDCCTCQQVLVHTQWTRCFRPGDRARIRYSGASTRSLPPQVTATEICRICRRC